MAGDAVPHQRHRPGAVAGQPVASGRDSSQRRVLGLRSAMAEIARRPGNDRDRAGHGNPHLAGVPFRLVIGLVNRRACPAGRGHRRVLHCAGGPDRSLARWTATPRMAATCAQDTDIAPTLRSRPSALRNPGPAAPKSPPAWPRLRRVTLEGVLDPPSWASRPASPVSCSPPARGPLCKLCRSSSVHRPADRPPRPARGPLSRRSIWVSSVSEFTSFKFQLPYLDGSGALWPQLRVPPGWSKLRPVGDVDILLRFRPAATCRSRR